ncbi:MAG: sigma-54-dependent Fis family transcriptional regulator [Acidobacteria bacterium]|nr:sigma-54-dependent Fis family transcriptional regulator [Acidobacteriota bacterium]
MTATVLIIDDDQSVTASLALMLKQAGYKSKIAYNPKEALEKLDKESFQLVLQDMNFSRETTGEEGLDLLKEIKNHYPSLPIILITAWGSISLAVKGMKAGAADFVTKPWTNQQLLLSVKTVLGLTEADKESPKIKNITREQLEANYQISSCIGNSLSFLSILEIATRVSSTDASVLITGESGTGKEVLAEVIHQNSKRCGKPFIKVNLGAIPFSLFESEIFGHVRGAFTGATQDRKGRFEVAQGGTIFLDEIGDLETSSQVKMLRVLQDRTYEVLGSSRSQTVDVRIITATNRSLSDMVAKGEFREDLLYRLNLISLHLPSLRERIDDIPILVKHFLKTLGNVYNRSDLSISNDALKWLQSFTWPGNIRQLRHVIERAVLITSQNILQKDDFALSLSFEQNEIESINSLPNVGSMTLDEIEKAMILKCLKHHVGNISKTAESLGLTRTSLYRRFEKYGIKL